MHFPEFMRRLLMRPGKATCAAAELLLVGQAAKLDQPSHVWWRPPPDLPLRRFSGKTTAMSAPKHELLQAVELALAGDWDAAHQIVQQHEDDATAAWIHAVLHKIEGDSANSRYWYRRADRLDRVAGEPRAELAALQTELTPDGHR